MMEIPEIKLRLVDGNEAGTFLATLDRLYCDLSDRNHPGLFAALVELHNSSELDLIEAFSHLDQESEEVDFFPLLNAFEKILPNLEADLAEVVKCVETLVQRAGNDGAANTPYHALQLFCEKSEARCDQLIRIVKEPAETSGVRFTIAALAGAKNEFPKYHGLALNELENCASDFRLQAMDALWRMDYANQPQFREATWAAVEALEFSNDDSLASMVIRCALQFAGTNGAEFPRLESIVRRWASCEGPATCNQVERLLNHPLFMGSEQLRETAFHSLKKVNPEHGGTLLSLDVDLAKLIDTDQWKWAVKLLESILCSWGILPKDKDVFPSIQATLLSHPEALSYLCTRWLLDGSSILCSFIGDLFDSRDGPYAIKADLTQIENLDPSIVPYLTRKAIGWLYHHPESVLSFALSCLPIISDPIPDDLGDLSFFPVGVSYPSKVRNFLKSFDCASDSRLESWIRNLDERIEAFQSGLASVGTLKELRMPTSQMEIAARKGLFDKDAFREGFEKHSILFSLCKKTTLLHGRSWINYQKTEDSSIKRNVGVMQCISTGISIPGLFYWDPQWVDYILSRFRAERRAS